MKIRMKHLKWCPNLCGKKVFYLASYSHTLELFRGYNCPKCKGRWSAKEFKRLK